MLYVVTVALYDRCSGAKTHHKHTVELGFIACSESVSNKLLCLIGRKSIYGFVDVSTAYTRKHHLLNIAELDMILMQILAEGSIERRNGVGSTNANWRQHLALLVNADNLCSAYAYINAYYYSHILELFL